MGRPVRGSSILLDKLRGWSSEFGSAITRNGLPLECESAVVIIGGLANPLGALAAGMLIGVAEALTMATLNPAWAPLVAFSILIALLLWKPKWL